MQLEIITPETKIFAGEVEAVQLPGMDGSFQVLNGHAPIISALKAGVVKVDLTNAFDEEEEGNKFIQTETNTRIIRIAIKGGVVELQQNKLIILAE